MNVNHENLVTALDRLKLTTIRDKLDNLLDEASRKEMNLREALAFFCERYCQKLWIGIRAHPQFFLYATCSLTSSPSLNLTPATTF